MVAAGTRLDTTYAMPEYHHPKFDGKMLGFKLGAPSNDKSDWNREKGGNFIDWYTKKKAIVPSPNQYMEVDTNLMSKKMPAYTLYKSPRKTDF